MSKAQQVLSLLKEEDDDGDIRSDFERELNPTYVEQEGDDLRIDWGSKSIWIRSVYEDPEAEGVGPLKDKKAILAILSKYDVNVEFLRFK